MVEKMRPLKSHKKLMLLAFASLAYLPSCTRYIGWENQRFDQSETIKIYSLPLLMLYLRGSSLLWEFFPWLAN